MKKAEQWFDDFLNEAQNSDHYKEEYLLHLQMRISRTIREMLKIQGINSRDLAQKLNCSEANVSKMLRGNNNFTVESLCEIAEALNCRLDLNFTQRMAEYSDNEYMRSNIIEFQFDEQCFSQAQEPVCA